MPVDIAGCYPHLDDIGSFCTCHHEKTLAGAPRT